MSIQDMYDSVQTLLEEHNEAIAPGKTNEPGQVDPQKAINCLKAAGGTTADRLKAFKYEDILQCLPAVEGIETGRLVKPIALAKDIAKVFRGNTTEASDEPRRPVSSKKASRMTPKELLESFDPDEPKSPIGKRLAEISRGEPCLIYKDETSRILDIDTSLAHLKEVKQGLPGVESFKVGDEIKKVYRVGELPQNFTDENPIYPGRPLRLGGTCDQTNRSWEGVGLSIRQMVRLVTEFENIELDIDKSNDLIDKAVGPDAFKRLRDRYRKAALRFDELKQTGDLPKLKIALGQLEGASPKGGRPFEGGRRVDMFAASSPVFHEGVWSASESYLRANRAGK